MGLLYEIAKKIRNGKYQEGSHTILSKPITGEEENEDDRCPSNQNFNFGSDFNTYSEKS